MQCNSGTMMREANTTAASLRGLAYLASAATSSASRLGIVAFGSRAGDGGLREREEVLFKNKEVPSHLYSKEPIFFIRDIILPNRKG